VPDARTPDADAGWSSATESFGLPGPALGDSHVNGMPSRRRSRPRTSITPVLRFDTRSRDAW
jgi:hypothetical protein